MPYHNFFSPLFLGGFLWAIILHGTYMVRSLFFLKTGEKIPQGQTHFSRGKRRLVLWFSLTTIKREKQFFFSSWASGHILKLGDSVIVQPGADSESAIWNCVALSLFPASYWVFPPPSQYFLGVLSLSHHTYRRRTDFYFCNADISGNNIN